MGIMGNNEEWRDVVGYEGRYQISNYGRLRSIDIVLHKRDGKTERRRGKILKIGLSKWGYPQYLFSKGSLFPRKLMRIHRVVATAFIPNPNNLPQIDHINRDRADNRVSNLRWCTLKENMNNPNTIEWLKVCRPNFHHTEETKRKISLIQKGKRLKPSQILKLRMKGLPVIQMDKDGNILAEFSNAGWAQEETGVCKAHICACCNQHRKTAGGFKWRYKNGGICTT